MDDLERLKIESSLTDALDKAIHGTGGIWPDWVYEARDAIRRQNENPPHFLGELVNILGWQGGTIHQALIVVVIFAFHLDRTEFAIEEWRIASFLKRLSVHVL